MLSPWTKSTTSIVSPFHNRRRGGGFNPSALFALSEPGVWFDPNDVANLSWRRNLLTFTEQFDNAVWTKANTTVTVDATTATAPNGTATADALFETTATGFHSANATSTIVAATAGQSYTFSFYLKANGRTKGFMSVVQGGDFTTFDLTAKTNVFGGNGTNITVTAQTITEFPNEWFRLTSTVSISGSVNIRPVIGISNDSNVSSYAGDATKGLYLWGAQLELGSVATDYQRISNVTTEVIERFPSATLYQDNAGTTPVTTPGDPVGLMLDKSKGLVLGSELVTNGNFSSGTTGWTDVTATLSVSSGEGLVTAASGFGYVRQVLNTVVGRTYLFTLNARIGTTNRVTFAVANGAVVAETTSATTTALRCVYTAAATTTNIWLQVNNVGTAFFDNISVKELPGFHATSTGTSRPTYGIVPLGGRRNLLTRTEEFNDAVWVKTYASITANSSVAPDGTTTADTLTPSAGSHAVYQAITTTAVVYTASVYFKQGTDTAFELQFNTAGFVLGVRLRYTFSTAATTVTLGGSPSNVSTNVVDVGNGWFRAVISVLCTAATTWYFDVHGITNGATSLIWGAQLEAGSTATNYQRVGAPSAVSGLSFDVTEAGAPSLSYLYFDGTDDFMVTPTITPGVNKVQVFAGVRKLSDAASATLVELSIASGDNSGTFVISASPGAIAGYSWRSRGTNSADVTSPANYAAPISNVVTGIGDIAGDVSRFRVNGAQVAETLVDQGTSNYLAYPLYIGRRGGTSLPFNGQLFSLIVRFGATVDATSITNTETWIGSKTPGFAVPTFVGVPTIGVA